MAPETKLLLVVTRGAFDACPGRHTSAPRGSFWITAVALFSDQLWGWAVNFVEKTKGYDQQMDAYKCLSVCMPVSVGFDKHLYIYLYAEQRLASEDTLACIDLKRVKTCFHTCYNAWFS